jgi:thioredoxin-dependent peroxiredoxin
VFWPTDTQSRKEHSCKVRYMKLTTDIKAPVFVLKDIFNRMIDLNDYADKRVFIGFFRHAGCPFCNLRVHALTKMHEELKQKGLEMIFFFESKESVLLRSMFHKEVSPIPLISDPQKEWYGAYGLENSALISAKSHITSFVQTAFKARKIGAPIHAMADGESINTIPAEFLLDKGLVIKKVHYAKGLNDRLDMDIVKAFAEDGSIIG